ncbi:unnamed protein product, partial [Rotaria magnacalcarata]
VRPTRGPGGGGGGPGGPGGGALNKLGVDAGIRGGPGVTLPGGGSGGFPKKNVMKQSSSSGMAAKLGITENNIIHNRI